MSYKAVSLFSGCGGFCEGARLSGFKVVAAVENDRFAVETYGHNFPEVPLLAHDVQSFMNDEDPVWHQHRDRFAHLDGNVDLVFGGPPCQGYSQIGPRDLEDPRNTLYREFLRVVDELRPRVVVMENVPNMLWLSKGLFREQILEAFAAYGYSNIDVRVLSADNFGVPQTRERAFFFAVRDDLVSAPDASTWMDKILGDQLRPLVTVDEAIGDLPEAVSPDYRSLGYPRSRRKSAFLDEVRLDRDGEWYSAIAKTSLAGRPRRLHNHHTKEIQERRRQLIGHLMPGCKADSLPTKYWNGTRPEKWRRFHPDRPAHTLLAQMHRDLSEWIHPRHDRWITVREAARLQSFHDGFVFQSSEWQMLKQIGNAVPPLLGRAVTTVAMELLIYLDQAAQHTTSGSTHESLCTP